jgi:hypothetical protein
MHILPWEAAARVRLLLSQENLLDNGGELAPTLITGCATHRADFTDRPTSGHILKS